jgi:hypothetical protein
VRPRGRPSVRAAALAVTLLAAAACDGPRSTPLDTLSTVKAAIASRDPRLLYSLHDQETLAHRRQKVAEWRALLARGDAPDDVLKGTNLTVEDVTTGTPEEVVGRLFAKHSPLLRDGEWMLSASVVSVTTEGDDAAAIRVRGTDGRESVLWLVRERGAWVVDHRRTWAPPPK